MRSVAVVQSNYIPWKGYFDLINSVDEFILFDDVQYTRRDSRNRNKIKTHSGPQWLTIPVQVKGRYTQRIDETRVADPNWGRPHWESLVHNYARSPYFAEYKAVFAPLYLENNEEYLSRVNYQFLTAVCRLLGIETRISWSTDYQKATGKTERLLHLCEQAGASEYLSGPSARSYLDEEKFHQAGLSVRWADYSGYPEYAQLFPPFDHYVTVLDLLFNEGPSARKYLLSTPESLAGPAAWTRRKTMTSVPALLADVGRYYTDKIREHGPGPRGVDWNSSESQRVRFRELLEIAPSEGPISLLDFGCGYGAVDYLVDTKRDFTYHGFDISAAMIEQARALHAAEPRCRFSDAAAALAPADYTVASGVFNVKLQSRDEDWKAYVLQTLDRLNDLSRLGFAFNVLTSYSDPERRRPDLYYADPCFLFDHCKRHYARNVSLVHDYDLYEFTLLVRKVVNESCN